MSLAISDSRVSKKARVPSSDRPLGNRNALNAPLPPPGPVDSQGRAAPEPLVHVDRGVGVLGRDRLARVEEHPFPVQRHSRKRGIECPIAPHRAGGDQARGAAGVLVHVPALGALAGGTAGVGICRDEGLLGAHVRVEPYRDAPTKSASNGPLSPPGPWRRARSWCPPAYICPGACPCRPLSRDSVVLKKTRVPSADRPRRPRERAVAARGAGRDQRRGPVGPVVDIGLGVRVGASASDSWSGRRRGSRWPRCPGIRRRSCRSRPRGQWRSAWWSRPIARTRRRACRCPSRPASHRSRRRLACRLPRRLRRRRRTRRSARPARSRPGSSSRRSARTRRLQIHVGGQTAARRSRRRRGCRRRDRVEGHIWRPFPPGEPVEIRVVVLPVRS